MLILRPHIQLGIRDTKLNLKLYCLLIYKFENTWYSNNIGLLKRSGKGNLSVRIFKKFMYLLISTH